MVYDWADQENKRGGVAYGWSDQPEGPFNRTESPIHLDTDQEPLLGKYVRVYAASIFKRAHDWLILAMMSTPGNAGGTWAHVAMTSPNPEGPYDGPVLLQYPQSMSFHPAPVEYFPAFEADGTVYAPATSVAANRTYQVVYAAPLEHAHEPAAWEIVQNGSVWHAEPVPHEADGIWGQTFSGAVTRDGRLLAMFPSRTKDNRGTINTAVRPWSQPESDGFVVSALNADALALLQRQFRQVSLTCRVTASGPFSLILGHRAPLGPDRTAGADTHIHPLSLTQSIHIRFSAEGLQIQDSQNGENRIAASHRLPYPFGQPCEITVITSGNQLSVRLNGNELCSLSLAVQAGRIGLLAHAGSIVSIDRFIVEGDAESSWISLLATDATMGSGAAATDWEDIRDDRLRYGIGCRSLVDGAVAKWNYFGRGFRLWGCDTNNMSVLVDGEPFSLTAHTDPADDASYVIAERHEESPGYHAVTVIARSAGTIIDSLDFLP